MKFPQIEDEAIGFQLAPLIDIVFLLIIFFMVAANMNQRRFVEIDVPVAAKSVVPKDPGTRMIVTVRKSGELFLGADPVSLEELSAAFAVEFRQAPSLQVVIRGDQQASFLHGKKVLQAAAEAGIANVIFAAYQQADTP